MRKSRWIRCPLCGHKSRTKVYENTVLLKFPLYCPKCRSETIVDVVKFELTQSFEPDV
ncbi:MAG: conjugal transfer protein [Clostridia bacterium]|nr:conjugal transfer protein [Clostridia bacterium]